VWSLSAIILRISLADVACVDISRLDAWTSAVTRSRNDNDVHRRRESDHRDDEWPTSANEAPTKGGASSREALQAFAPILRACMNPNATRTASTAPATTMPIPA